MKRSILAAVTLLLALALFACGQGKKQEAKVRPPAPVIVAAAGKQTIPVQLEAIGIVEPVTTVSVKSMVNGEVLKVHFQEGQDVSKGQILFTLDQRQAEAS